jgi:hypothetical protein
MNYPLPAEPAPNEPLRATWGAQLIRWARANTLLPTPGMLLSRTAAGTSFRPQATPSAAAPATTTDFALSDASTPTQTKVGVLFGTVTPNGINASDPAYPGYPDNFVEDDGTPDTSDQINVTANSSGLILLQDTVDPDPAGDGSQPPVVSDFTIIASPTLPNQTATLGYLILGAYVAGAASVQILSGAGGAGPQVFGYCGGSHYYDPASGEGSPTIVEQIIAGSGGGGS